MTTALENERKFIISDVTAMLADVCNSALSRDTIYQHYNSGLTTRIRKRISRSCTCGEVTTYTITQKSGLHADLSRSEREMEMPADLFDMLLDDTSLFTVHLKKIRICWNNPVDGLMWELDCIQEDDGSSFWLAEIELQSMDSTFHKPSWIGNEVTGDDRYMFVNIAQHGYPRGD